MHVYVQHGWGYAGLDWSSRIASLSGVDHVSAPCRGYFGPIVEVYDMGAPQVLIAHSMGLHWVPDQIWSSVSKALILAPFYQFLGCPPQRERSVWLRAMQTRLVRDPAAVIRAFRARCSDKIAQDRPCNAVRLQHDLELLSRSSFDFSKLLGLEHVLLWHGMDDSVVPCSWTSAWPEVQRMVQEGEGHTPSLQALEAAWRALHAAH
ncbi:MAG: hypothetical protein KDK78_02165 [Chlamydiia bacterium]|nr:hypothetical protein [Chlamydiia bacterium]